MRQSFASLLVLAALAAAAPAAAEPIFPKSSGVGLEPPPGMKEAERFLGFQDGRATIVISELPAAAFAQVSGKKQQLAGTITDGKLQDIAVPGASAFMIVGTQKAAGLDFHKWVVVLGNADETAVVTAQIPAEGKASGDAAIDKALHSITLRKRPDLAAQIAALPFSIGDEAGFHPFLAFAGAALMLTDGPHDNDPAQPLAIVATDPDFRDTPPATGLLDFAKQRFTGIASRHAQNVVVKDATVTDDAGGKTAKVAATGERGPGKTPVVLLDLVRVEKSGFAETLCVMPATAEATYSSRCETLARSVHLKKG